jgi:hypothetical protein
MALFVEDAEAFGLLTSYGCESQFDAWTVNNKLPASQQQPCTAAAYVTMQLFGSQAQRAASIQM